jgi:hypothetical protein
VRVEIDPSVGEEMNDPAFQQRLADFQAHVDVLVKDPREKFRLCIHEAGHISFYRRLGWAVDKFRGPHIARDEEGKLHNFLGAVSPVRVRGGEIHDLVEAVKCDTASFVLVEALTGEPNSETAIKNDMRVISTFDPEVLKEVLELATEGILQELKDVYSSIPTEVVGAARDFENAVFGTDDNWLWGWKKYRLDLPGLRYIVGHDQLNWLLIDGGSRLRLIVDGVEVFPDTKRYELIYVFGGGKASEKSADAVRRWNQMIRAATQPVTQLSPQ